jgi:hypothetical protein
MIQTCVVHYLRVLQIAPVTIISLAGLLALAVDAHGQLAIEVNTGTRTPRYRPAYTFRRGRDHNALPESARTKHRKQFRVRWVFYRESY